MRNKASISVVMSVCNGEKYLAEAIESILNQTYKNFEFIIVNDGSKDNSLEIIKNYMKQDNRIVLIDRENKGLPYSLNEGISIAKGEYIARMDADDISLPIRFEKQIDYMQKYNVDFVYSDTLLIDKNGDEICKSYRPRNMEIVLCNLEIYNLIPHPTVLIKREIFNEYGGYNISCKTGQDLELWLRLRDKIKFGYINECLLKYRLNPNSMRQGIYDNYWFTVTNYAIWNNHKLKAFKYFRKLSLREKIIILIKMLLPFGFYYRMLK
ncbi:MAG: glycosyltransferase [Campylobacterales bacterium]|nr:glycosyltransferase [Campylobacterales bacterium]